MGHFHAMEGMDAVYLHVTDDMRQHLVDVLEGWWWEGIAERYQLAPRSAVPLLDDILLGYAQRLKDDPEPQEDDPEPQGQA